MSLTDDQRFQQRLTSHAHEQDLYKHTATLSTGALVLLATFLEKAFQEPVAKSWVQAAMIAFCASIVGAVVMQLMSVLNVENSKDHSAGPVERLIFLVSFPLTFGGFLTGVLSLLVFAVKNLHRP